MASSTEAEAEAEAEAASPATRAPERAGLDALSPLVQAMDAARRTAMDRMSAECSALGADGVVGLRLTRGPYPLGGHEFTAIGTAVRARGAKPGQRAPFTSGLSGQDFAKLIMKGWVPAGFVLGCAMGACHDDWRTFRQTRRWSGNTEVAGWTRLVNAVRRDARRQLESDVQRFGAEGVVVAGLEMQVRQRDCPEQTGGRDHVVEAALFGTAVARFSRAGHGAAGAPVAVLRLGLRA
jgi:uncharacterized protein YbjQ (UPF0145 family)